MTQPAATAGGFGEWAEWHYRHAFFWSAATKWIVAILATAAVPCTAQLFERRSHSVTHQRLRRPIAWRIAPYLFSVLAIGFLSLTGLNLVFSQTFMERQTL